MKNQEVTYYNRCMTGRHDITFKYQGENIDWKKDRDIKKWVDKYFPVA